MTKHAVIFDMDGVLIDTEPLYSEKILQLLERYGVARSSVDLSAYCGLNPKTSAKTTLALFPFVKQSEHEIEKAFYDMTIDVFHDFLNKVSLIPGVYAFIRGLHEQGIHLAVASSSSAQAVYGVLDHFALSPFMEAVITGDRVEKGKPEPEIYLKAAAALEVPPENCIGVEDAFNGMLAVKAAKMTCFGFSGTDHYGTDFSNADFLFPKFDESVLQKALSVFHAR